MVDGETPNMETHFRLATPDDAAQVLAVYGPYCFTPTSFESAPPSVEDMRQRITRVLEHHPWLVCEQDAEIVGYVYACPHRERVAYRWSVDTAVYLHPQCQRRGLGRGLYTSLFRILVLQGYINAYAGVTLPNPASVGLHQAMGFEQVGVYREVGYKYGEWHDVAWFELLLQPRPSDPESPKLWRQIEGSEEWRRALNAGLPLVRR
jgi:L-amino acid N-acyltransferase YncA